MDPGAHVGGGAGRRASGLEPGKGHETVAVNRDDGRLGAFRQPLGLLGDDEAREVVGDHDGGAPGEPGHKAATSVRFRLHERPVGESKSGGGGAVVAHPFQHEAMQAGARPGIVEPESLVDHERLAALLGLAEGEVEGMVALQSAIGLHPVQDVVAPLTVPASARVAGADLRVAHDLIVSRETMVEA